MNISTHTKHPLSSSILSESVSDHSRYYVTSQDDDPNSLYEVSQPSQGPSDEWVGSQTSSQASRLTTQTTISSLTQRDSYQDDIPNKAQRNISIPHPYSNRSQSSGDNKQYQKQQYREDIDMDDDPVSVRCGYER